jgi:hypothetical protein
MKTWKSVRTAGTSQREVYNVTACTLIVNWEMARGMTSSCRAGPHNSAQGASQYAKRVVSGRNLFCSNSGAIRAEDNRVVGLFSIRMLKMRFQKNFTCCVQIYKERVLTSQLHYLNIKAKFHLREKGNPCADRKLPAGHVLCRLDVE